MALVEQDLAKLQSESEDAAQPGHDRDPAHGEPDRRDGERSGLQGVGSGRGGGLVLALLLCLFVDR